MIGIYMYENKRDHKKYIGQSINIERRRKEHINRPSPYSKFDSYLSKLGEESFNFIILEECLPEQLNDREQYWIKHYQTVENGYNLTGGGQTYKGEANPFSKLKEEQVKEIIKLLETTTLNNRELANKFNVHRNTIDDINRCQTWAYLHDWKENIRNESLEKRNFKGSSFSRAFNRCAVITEAQALQIIELLKVDKRSIAQLSRDLGINLNILYDINRCKTWKYLHDFNKNIRNEYKVRGDA